MSLLVLLKSKCGYIYGEMHVTFLRIYWIICEEAALAPKNENLGKWISKMINEQVQDQIKSIDNRLLHMWRYL